MPQLRHRDDKIPGSVSRRGSVIILAAMLAAAFVKAQEPQASPPAQPPAAATQPRFAAFNLVALDSKGHPVTDLHSGDLKVEDNGKPLPITFFKSSGPVEGALPEPLKPGEYSNATVPVRNTTVILFDLLNEEIVAGASGANELITALQHAESPERIALIILTRDGKFFAVHDFPGASPEADVGTAPWTAQIRPVLEKAMKDVVNHHNGDDRELIRRSTDTLNAVAGLASRMSAIPGRKTLIWVTTGVSVEFHITGDEINLMPSLEKMASGMNGADITAYTVRQSGAGAGQALGTQASITLDKLTQLTGGRSYASDQVGQALTESAIDARASYRIGFYPPADYWNDKSHKIRITSTRPDARLRSVAGFTPLSKDANRADNVALLTAPGTLPSDLSQIGLRATVSPGSKGGLHFQITVKPGDLPFEQNGEKFLSQLSVAFLEYDKEISAAPPNSILQPKSVTTPGTVKLALTHEQMEQVTQEGVTFGDDVMPSGSIRSVRLVVYNRAANEYGTLTVPVTPQ